MIPYSHDFHRLGALGLARHDSRRHRRQRVQAILLCLFLVAALCGVEAIK